MEEEVNIKFDIPTPYPPEQEAFVRCTTKRQVVKAGRQAGKTYGSGLKATAAFLGSCAACAGEGCVLCDNTGRVPWQRVLYAAPTIAQVEAFWYVVTEILSPGIEIGYFKKNESEHYIEVPGTQQRIKAKTAWNAATMRGDWADLAILEEYQMWNEDGWESVVQPMLLKRDGTAVFIFTPPSLRSEGASKAKDPRHASKLYKKYENDEGGRWKTFHFPSNSNPYLSKKALEEITTGMSMDVYRREIMAEDDEIETSWLVYHRFNEDVCKIKQFDIPKTWPIVTGHDFGEANPAALFLAKVKLPLPEGAPSSMRYGDYVLFREYAPGASSSSQHIEKFQEITKGYTVEQSVGGNLNSEEQIRQLYGANGWPISVPPMTKVNAQIDRVIGLMELNKLHIFEDLYGVLGQIYNCLWELDLENRPINKIKNESRYHFLACLRYLCSYLPAERIPREEETDKVKVGVW